MVLQSFTEFNSYFFQSFGLDNSSICFNRISEFSVKSDRRYPRGGSMCLKYQWPLVSSAKAVYIFSVVDSWFKHSKLSATGFSCQCCQKLFSLAVKTLSRHFQLSKLLRAVFTFTQLVRLINDIAAEWHFHNMIKLNRIVTRLLRDWYIYQRRKSNPQYRAWDRSIWCTITKGPEMKTTVYIFCDVVIGRRKLGHMSMLGVSNGESCKKYIV